MTELTSNRRYGGPLHGRTFKLDDGDNALVTLTGAEKGYIRCGTRAFACLWLPLNASARTTYIYVSKGGAMNLLTWATRNLPTFAAPFHVVYEKAGGTQFVTVPEWEEWLRMRGEIQAVLAVHSQAVLERETGAGMVLA